MRIDENVKRTRPSKKFSFYAGFDIRKSVMTDSSIKTLLKDARSLDGPLRSKIKTK